MLGTVTMQATQVWRDLQSPWTICYEPRNHMPVSSYGVMKTALERMEADVRSVLGLRYTTGIALQNMARWMWFALGECRARSANFCMPATA